MDALKLIAEGCVKEANPAIRVGDVVKVQVKISEGERERIQVFEGTIIARKGAGVFFRSYHGQLSACEQVFGNDPRVSHGLGDLPDAAHLRGDVYGINKRRRLKRFVTCEAAFLFALVLT